MKHLLLPATLAAVIFLAACGNDGDDGSADSPEPVEAAFEEGNIRVEIETLDTGLLKGHAYVNADDGWTVDGVDVTAITTDGTEWGVIEIIETGPAEYTTFFEVQVQELPRGDQITITAEAFFLGENGLVSERSAVDTWPP